MTAPVRHSMLKVSAGTRHRFDRLADEAPSIPQGLSEMTNRDAALALALSGWYVLPTSSDPADVKRPGSVVGSHWHWESSRDLEQIDSWWETDPDRGVALHVGRSRAIGFDLDADSLDHLPDELALALRSGLVQKTRTGDTDRGHYLFAMAVGDDFGNGAGAFAPFGEVRGRNGVLICEPTVHPKASDGGQYHWETFGVLPPLPDVLRACLNATPALEVAPFTSAALDAFLREHGKSERVSLLDGVVTVFEQDVAKGMARHEALVRALPMAFREAMVGCYPARDAYARLEGVFEAAFTASASGDGALNRGRSSPGPNEFRRTAEWAAAQAAVANPEDTLARINRDDPAHAVVDEDAFWDSRPALAHLRLFARSRRVGPWSMLGAVLARVLAVVPPSVVLPPTIGSHASLNFFVALVAASGDGKGSSESAAADAIDTTPEVFVATPGSGEGIPKQYAYKASGRQVNQRNSVMFSVAEIDTLAALGNRSSSTLMPELRKAWMGERLGFGYATVDKAVPILDHRYRMTMVVGVQPGRSRALLEDSDGGTTQRFLWMPTTDPDAPDEAPDNPGVWAIHRWPKGVVATHETASSAQPVVEGGEVTHLIEVDVLGLQHPVKTTEFQVLGLPRVAVDLIHSTHLVKLRGEARDGLDGHAILARLKVAAALMVLDARTDAVNESDWDLAGVVMTVSDRTRAQVQKDVAYKASQMNHHRGKTEGEREVVKAEVVDKARLKRVSSNLRKHLRKSSPLTMNQIRKRIAQRDRELVEDALGHLVEVGDVEVEDFEYKGTKGVRVSWAG
ncbi:bifunctional DNA primase/polymerase [Rhodococcoides fascians]|uniref:bifunctional DNA primase/polymerase n=1 Tax=Rhodococcoides fascians TaxID=1828 RepID=UPI000690116B|nr:bifunctional DNA primase/polymerase [Rhodococcus fascians]